MIFLKRWLMWVDPWKDPNPGLPEVADARERVARQK
jgi:hypothetical protein